MDQIEYEHPEIPNPSEVFWNFIYTPIILYAGFGRVTILSQRKSTLTSFAQA